MRPRQLNLHLALRHLIGAAVAVAWVLGAVSCCHMAQSGNDMPQMPAASTSAVGHAAAHHAVAVAEHGAVLTHLCTHRCSDVGMAVLQACQVTGFVALIVIVAMAAVAVPLAGPVVAGTRDPPIPIRPFNQYLGRNILDRICICRC